MVHRSAITSPILACLLVLLVAISANARIHDVSPGMRLEDALTVAKQCVIEATRYNDPRKEILKEIRAQDSLEFAGITDQGRLTTLRRYVVRNTRFGVQSIWGVRLNEAVARPYILPNFALADIAKTWTIEKLAVEIAKNAGLPLMSYKKASQIIANCRADIKSPPKGEAPPDLSKLIVQDLDVRQQARFHTCLISSEERGIQSAGVTDGEGDLYPYATKDHVGALKRIIDTSTYFELTSYLHNDIYAPLSSDLTASIEVYNELISIFGPCTLSSFQIRTLCTTGVEIKMNLTVSQLVSGKPYPAFGQAKLKAYRGDQHFESTSIDLSNFTISPEKTVSELIDDVKKELKRKAAEQRKAEMNK